MMITKDILENENESSVDRRKGDLVFPTNLVSKRKFSVSFFLGSATFMFFNGMSLAPFFLIDISENLFKNKFKL